ncbi:hypothetical protein [Acetobacter syzygii]|uniref:DUF3592 domain-containing protein n=1 Tax=Acetobacter syzygii TaxID=146476 RepID=A0A270BDH8_9PROT|nr:hypothetical protein [Acetobacter syzygii]NSL93078.1 hypothetical protein [Acetobacter syzygii]PAL23075.1 hypothetical protein B9K05_10780 [Acetobacter syzygii]PAL24066.1 hypothetical protein B9K04_10745 [Acetobacter syzygii]GAN71363.1 hypothetical protein Absy_016_025 [Acetobacter syzygii]GBR63822.1 hypothetical protein AA0483_1071 [Acetobacter syzygii NRIC 0483]
MSKNTKEFFVWVLAFVIVGGVMWGGSILLHNYRQKQWDQFVVDNHCKITGTQPSTGFFSPEQTIYQCDNTGIYYRNK